MYGWCLIVTTLFQPVKNMGILKIKIHVKPFKNMIKLIPK